MLDRASVASRRRGPRLPSRDRHTYTIISPGDITCCTFFSRHFFHPAPRLEWSSAWLERSSRLEDDRSVIARARAVLAAASTIHFVHDGFSDILYVFLPLWASEFGLSLAQVGVIRTTYTGGMALFQIPAGFLAERWGERRLLVAGTAVTALRFVAAGWAGGFLSLLRNLLPPGPRARLPTPPAPMLFLKALAGRGPPGPSRHDNIPCCPSAA